MRLAAVADIHLKSEHQENNIRAFTAVNELADALVIAGDFTNHGQPEEMRACLAVLEHIKIPIIGSYGEKDTSIPAEDLRTWRAGLRVPNDIRIYPSAGHAFFDDTRSSYVASAAEDAWKRTIGFFGEALGLPKT